MTNESTISELTEQVQEIDLKDCLDHTKQIDLLSYYTSICSSHRQKITFILAVALSVFQIFFIVPLENYSKLTSSQFDFVTFMVATTAIVSCMGVLLVYHFANFFTASTNRVLTEANYLIHYYAESNDQLIKIDHSLRDNESFSKSVFPPLMIFALISVLVFIAKLSYILYDFYQDNSAATYFIGCCITALVCYFIYFTVWSYKLITKRIKSFLVAQKLLLGIRTSPNPQATIDSISTELGITKFETLKSVYHGILKNV